jgi:hypothetical protein
MRWVVAAMCMLLSGAGCAPRAAGVFHTVYRGASWLDGVSQVRLVVGSDPRARAVADALAVSLGGRVPAEVVATLGTASPDTLIVRVSLERTVLGQEAAGPGTDWTVTPVGTYMDAPSRPRDEVSVSYAVTLGLSRQRVASIRRYVREEGSALSPTESRVLRAVVQDLVSELASRERASDIEVTWTGDGDADRAIRAALEHRSPRLCVAIAHTAERLSGEQRGRAFLAAARCDQALYIDTSLGRGLDRSLLDRASSLLEQARAAWPDEGVDAAMRDIASLREAP